MNGLLVRRHSKACPFGANRGDWYIETVKHVKRFRNQAKVVMRCQSLDCRAQLEITIDLLTAIRFPPPATRLDNI